MAEIVYKADYGRHSISIDSLSPEEAMGELSLSVMARSNWGGDHVMSHSFVLLSESDVIALQDALDACMTDIKERKLRDKANGKHVPEPVSTATPKKFRPRKRVTPKRRDS